MTPEEQIQYWKSKFTVLKDWDIRYEEDSSRKIRNSDGGVALYKIANTMVAKIVPWRGSGEMPEDYIFHEICHLVFSCIKKMGVNEYLNYNEDDPDMEEITVRELCNIVFDKERT